MVIFYHGDMDGIVAARFYHNHKFVRDNTKKEEFVQFEYGKQNQIKEMNFSPKEEVSFLDCSPDRDVLEYVLSQTKKVFIIDHHVSRKEMLLEYFDEGRIKGLFYNGACAALITYVWMNFVETNEMTIPEAIEYLDWFSLSKENQIEDTKIPLALKLINSWDIWNEMYPDAESYKIYFEMQNFTPDDKRIDELIFGQFEIANAVAKGNVIKEYVKSWGNKLMENFGYEVRYLSNKFFVANLGCGNSKYFGDLIDKYDAVITYCNNGKFWQCSIYSSSNNDFDCAEFAIKFGGGGHKKAAGFTLIELPSWLMNKYDLKLV